MKSKKEFLLEVINNFFDDNSVDFITLVCPEFDYFPSIESANFQDDEGVDDHIADKIYHKKGQIIMQEEEDKNNFCRRVFFKITNKTQNLDLGPIQQNRIQMFYFDKTNEANNFQKEKETLDKLKFSLT